MYLSLFSQPINMQLTAYFIYDTILERTTHFQSDIQLLDKSPPNKGKLFLWSMMI